MSSVIVADKRRQRLVLFSISFGSFMVNVDTYIVNISLPTIAQSLHADPGQVAWVSLAYNLTVASLLLIVGKLGDRLGLKRLFILGFGLFTLSSLLCGLAPSLSWLIVGRCVQGIGASVLYAMTPAMIPKYLPREQRGAAFGALATMTALGMSVGAPLGGLITGFLSWHWIFLINIPVGILAIGLSQRVIPNETADRSSVESGSGFDVLGAFLSFAGSLALIYGLNMGRTLGWFSTWIAGCFLASVLSVALFIVWERRVRFPLVDLTLFRSKAFSFGNLASIPAYAFLAGNNFLIPFYLITVKGLSASHAGLTVLVYSLVYMVTGPIAGRLSTRIPPRMLCTAAMVLGTCDAFGFALTLRAPGLAPVIVHLVFFAITFGVFTTSNNNVIMGMAPDGKQGVVAGVFRMIVRLGLAVGVCTFETILSMTALGTTAASKTAFAELPKDVLAVGFRNAFIAGGVACMLALIASHLARTSGNMERAAD